MPSSACRRCLGNRRAGRARPQNVTPFKIGFIVPMTGQSASTGRQFEAAAKLYLAQNGSSYAGPEVELIIKDDAGVADTTRRLARS
jgi:branched-chain amino acid transport system substrate-binding protein